MFLHYGYLKQQVPLGTINPERCSGAVTNQTRSRTKVCIKNQNPDTVEKVDVLGNVECEIIRILLFMYGNRTA
jgi:hypothetical protein